MADLAQNRLLYFPRGKSKENGSYILKKPPINKPFARNVLLLYKKLSEADSLSHYNSSS